MRCFTSWRDAGSSAQHLHPLDSGVKSALRANLLRTYVHRIEQEPQKQSRHAVRPIRRQKEILGAEQVGVYLSSPGVDADGGGAPPVTQREKMVDGERDMKMTFFYELRILTY